MNQNRKDFSAVSLGFNFISICTANTDCRQDFSWPGWADLVDSVSHLALPISSSLSFYIYIALYGAKHKVVIHLYTSVKKNWSSYCPSIRNNIENH